MEDLSLPGHISKDHHRRLMWFFENTGSTVGWPIQLSDGTLLANRAKGIYKPEGIRYALSVKQTLGSPYADKEPVYGRDGAWTYLYYQEEQEGKDPEELSTNKAMRLCMSDGIPVGVLRQLSPKPNVRYRVLGLARILGKAAGYYLLEGIPSLSSSVPGLTPAVSKEPLIYSGTDGLLRLSDASDLPAHEKPAMNEDLRIFRLRSVVQRQGQAAFREKLMHVYESRCAVSSCDVQDVLEAAHVLPYRGPQTNEASNGILLRADLHILFDEGLLAIDPQSMLAQIAPSLRKNAFYGPFDGMAIHKGGAANLDRELLRAHKHYCGF